MKPAWRILANGLNFGADLGERLLSLDITDEAGIESDQCTLTIADPQGQFRLPNKGRILDIALGYHPQPVEMGRFVIDEVNISGPPDTIRINARAADFLQSLKQKKSRGWPFTTLGRMVETIAAEHELDAAIATEFQDMAFSHIDQVEESDMHLLTRLAEECGAVIKPVERVLTCIKRGTPETATGQILPTITIDQNSLTRWQFTSAGRIEYGSVSARWRDWASGTVRVHTETAPTGTGPEKRLSKLYPNNYMAKTAAKAALDKVTLEGAKLSLNMPGRPEIFAAAPLQINHPRPDISGRWIAQRVTHRMAADGFTTQIEATKPL